MKALGLVRWTSAHRLLYRGLVRFENTRLSGYLLIVALGVASPLAGCDEEKPASDDASSEDDGDGTKKKKRKKRKKKKSGKKKAKAEAKTDDAASASSGYAKSDDGSIPPPKPGDFPKLIVGGWTKYESSGIGTITYGVLGKEGSVYHIDGNVQGRIGIKLQAWVDVPDDWDRRTSKIVDLQYQVAGMGMKKVKGGNITGEAKIYEDFMKRFVHPKFEGMPQEDVTAPAGTFRGCFRWVSKQEYMGHTSEVTIWSHPAVPAPAMVRMKSKDGKTSWELVSYGTSGAKSSF